MTDWAAMTPTDAKKFMEEHRGQHVRKTIAERVGGRLVLDVGCGKGMEISALYYPGQYRGIDPSIELVKLAREQNPGFSFEVADGRKLPFEDHRFDVAICCSVLEHQVSLEDSRAIFYELCRVARVAYVVWHTPPIYKETEIIVIHGVIPDPCYQNHYQAGSFPDPPGKKIVTEKFPRGQIWTIS